MAERVTCPAFAQLVSDMSETYACDYCRATIDTSSSEALIIAISRDVDDDEWGDTSFVTGTTGWLRFCSQAHAATYLERTPLPQDFGEDNDGLGESWGCAVVALLLGLVALALAVGAAYGLVQLVRES